MSTVVYRYKRLKNLEVPIITLAIRYGKRWYPLEAYVDSGATYSVFTAQVANRIGLDYRTGRKEYVQVGDGGFIPVFIHDLELQIGKHRIRTPLGFSDKLGIRFNLLGRTGVFRYFKICFDERQFEITFSPHEA
ncbi:MAG: retropepsin-like domain-containing protein [Deltaproteobacteria bacterium]|nr:retropepsin-like domain-containing protein [Deltaproteobacteria bacterium]